MTAADFEAASCPRGRTKLRKLNFIPTRQPAAGINFLLAAGLNISNEVPVFSVVPVNLGRGLDVYSVGKILVIK
jgi:hypothetical protein